MTDAKRGRRTRAVRAKTLARKARQWLLPEEPSTPRSLPQVRSECENGVRPCPYVTCKYHLYLDVNPRTGSIKLNFPDIEVDEMNESCALDIADKTNATLEEVGVLLNITRERVRQIETISFAKIDSRIFKLFNIKK